MRQWTAGWTGIQRFGVASLAVAALLTQILAPAPEAVAQSPVRPNLLLITTSHQRFDSIAALGNPVIQTPNLDRLVDQGVAFTHATVSTPASSPSRWSTLTGRYTSSHGRSAGGAPAERPAASLVDSLRRGGYRTGLVGKNDTFLESGDLAWLAVTSPEEGNSRPEGTTARALEFIRQSSPQPFFLWVSYSHPDPAYDALDPFDHDYATAIMPPPLVEPDGLAAAGKPFRQRYQQAHDDALPTDRLTVQRLRRAYYATTSRIDAEIGILLDELDTTDIASDTLIVFTGDQGSYLGDHGLTDDAVALYDAAVRVPLLVRWSDQVGGPHVDAAPVSNVDIMPTLLDAAGVEIPESTEGVSLLRFLNNATLRFPRDASYSEHGSPGEPYDMARAMAEAPGDTAPDQQRIASSGPIRMIRTVRWKFIDEPGGTCELYDLRIDPGELVNRCSDPAVRPTRTALHARLTAWLASRGMAPDEASVAVPGGRPERSSLH